MAINMLSLLAIWVVFVAIRYSIENYFNAKVKIEKANADARIAEANAEEAKVKLELKKLKASDEHKSFTS